MRCSIVTCAAAPSPFGAAVTTVVLSLSCASQVPGLPEGYLCSVGSVVAAAFPIGILIAVAVSTRRHPGAFRRSCSQAC